MSQQGPAGAVAPLTVSVADAMAMTGLGMTKLYELMNDGTVATVKIGRRRLVKVESLRRLVEAEAA